MPDTWDLEYSCDILTWSGYDSLVDVWAEVQRNYNHEYEPEQQAVIITRNKHA